MVTLLAGPTVVANVEGVASERFGTAAELDQAIGHALAAGPVDLFFMAAAVSDWAPIRHAGKIVSHGEDLVLSLAPVPKILPTLRERCGGRTTLVGFKLLSRVSDEALIHAAQQQIREARTDFCVANDLQRIRDRHPVLVVGRDGSVTMHDGTKEEVAEAIVERVWRTG
jgi:phosphopantothenoylcysteine decarboxylase/phosphopantothenate--cysteine ligase